VTSDTVIEPHRKAGGVATVELNIVCEVRGGKEFVACWTVSPESAHVPEFLQADVPFEAVHSELVGCGWTEVAASFPLIQGKAQGPDGVEDVGLPPLPTDTPQLVTQRHRFTFES
jgi:hypothetical protein